jgi:predicted nucleic acid-binding protein
VTLYVDTSCLLKLFFLEPETPRTMELIAAEPQVIVSSLTRLEALVQIQGRVTARELPPSAAEHLRRRIDRVLRADPFEVVPCPPDVIDMAEAQIRRRRAVHCRTLDRLHLAIMQSLGLDRLLTNDGGQARAARALGFEAILPR